MARFYLDEDLPPRVASIARSLGVDAVSSHECGRNGLSDAEQLRLAGEEGRCMVTRNRDDFIALTTQFFTDGRPHAGLLIVPRSLPNRDPARIGHALAAYSGQHEGDIPSYTATYLAVPPR